jgi:osmotically-inducible protein OsmY
VNGKVVLRGEADSAEMIEELVGRARSVQGVQEVESLLHTPGEPAPMHE